MQNLSHCSALVGVGLRHLKILVHPSHTGHPCGYISAPYNRCLSRTAGKKLNVSKIKISKGLTVPIYILCLLELAKNSPVIPIWENSQLDTFMSFARLTFKALCWPKLYPSALPLLECWNWIPKNILQAETFDYK